MNRRTDVVQKSRQRKFSRPCAATDGVTRLEQKHFSACLRQTDRRCQTVRTGPDHYRIVRFRFQIFCLIDHNELMRNADTTHRAAEDYSSPSNVFRVPEGHEKLAGGGARDKRNHRIKSENRHPRPEGAREGLARSLRPFRAHYLLM